MRIQLTLNLNTDRVFVKQVSELCLMYKRQHKGYGVHCLYINKDFDAEFILSEQVDNFKQFLLTSQLVTSLPRSYEFIITYLNPYKDEINTWTEELILRYGM